MCGSWVTVVTVVAGLVQRSPAAVVPGIDGVALVTCQYTRHHTQTRVVQMVGNSVYYWGSVCISGVQSVLCVLVGYRVH